MEVGLAVQRGRRREDTQEKMQHKHSAISRKQKWGKINEQTKVTKNFSNRSEAEKGLQQLKEGGGNGAFLNCVEML